MGEGRDSHRRDRDGLRRLARGETHALEEIYDRHVASAWRHALWVTGRQADADDVVQTVFAHLAGRGADLLGIRNLRAYLAAMVHHESIRVLRQRRAQDPDEAALDADSLLSPSPSPEHEAERSLLARHVASLPAAQRAVLLLRLHAGFSFREIGRALGVSTFTAASRWRLALARLRRALAGKP